MQQLYTEGSETAGSPASWQHIHQVLSPTWNLHFQAFDLSCLWADQPYAENVPHLNHCYERLSCLFPLLSHSLSLGNIYSREFLFFPVYVKGVRSGLGVFVFGLSFLCGSVAVQLCKSYVKETTGGSWIWCQTFPLYLCFSLLFFHLPSLFSVPSL